MTMCPTVPLVESAAGHFVRSQLEDMRDVATDAVKDSRELATELAGLTFQPVPTPSLPFAAVTYPGYNAPSRPSFSAPGERFGEAPPARPSFSDPDLTALDAVKRPNMDVPDAPDLSIPATPTLVAPVKPGAAPSFEDVSLPDYTAMVLPEVPTLEQLNIPDAPEVSIDHMQVDRPDFKVPFDRAYDNRYTDDTRDLQAEMFTQYLENDPDAQTLRDRWQQMIDGGTGLPPDVEQALFDRAISREDVSTEQAVRQAQGEWAARGFSLPGSTLLARESEIRRASRVERGRANREIMVQAHQQEIENLRFAVQQGVALEGQRFEHVLRTWDAARQVVSGSYEVARALLSAHIEMLNAQVQVYQADIQAFREAVQIELARLEAFRSEVEAERIKGEINEQRVRLFTAQLQAVQQNVDVYRAEIEGANGKIQAQVAQMQMYTSRLDAYRTEWEGERIKFDTYATRVSAEDAKTRLFTAQVQAFSERINAYRTEVEAASTKIDAVNTSNDTTARRYGTEVDAWSRGVSSDIERLQAAVSEFSARIQMYGTDVQGEQTKMTGLGNNARLAIEDARAQVAAILKKADQEIAQLELANTLGQRSLEGAAQVNSQLAASALSAVNLGASVSDSFNNNRSMSSSCRTNYSGEVT